MSTCETKFEHFIALNEVPRILPLKKGKRVHYSTVFRWASYGLKGNKLSTVKIGNALFTTEEALMRFLRQTTDSSSDLLPTRSAASHKAIDQEADRLGLGD